MNLYHGSGTSNSRPLIGEGGNGTITYSFGGDATPQGRDSTTSDTALIVYTFPIGGGITVPAGTSQEFSLEMDTTQLDDSKSYAVSGQLLGGTDFVWSDVAYGNGPTLYGEEGMGFPISDGIDIRR